MYFKRLELSGFKSFANPVTIEFNEGITCVVGPNGSGKSNVSDAIRWVLGEQSPKMLRGGRMEDVIFSGTQSRKAKGMAEVTLVIDNSDRTLDIDFAEVGISRRVYRSGESEYMINRIPCRLRDIRELIMDTGIGVEGYSVIGQGKIADIVSNKMDSRREIFEEAAGIVKYRSKREETERKLQASSDNLERVNDIASEIESRIDGLKSDSEKAEEYLQIRDKYRYNEINIIVKNIDVARSKLEAASEELSELAEMLESSLKDKAELEAALRDARGREQGADEKLDSLNEEISKASEEIYALENREELGRERSAGLERDRLRIEAELSGIEEKLGKEEESYRTVESSRLGVAKEEEEARRKALEKKAAAEQVQEELLSAERDLAEQKEMMLVLTGRISSANAEISGLESIKTTLGRRLEKLSDSDSAAESERIEAKIKDLKGRLSDAGKERDRLEEASLQLEKRRAELVEKLSKNAAFIEDRRVAGGKISARYKLLEELEKAYEGYSGAVRFVMQSGLSGITGTVGDLLKVPEGWELAIETALGGRIQNIVCDSDDDAKRAIELLKKNQAGRVTFLPEKSLRASDAADTSTLAGSDGYLGLASQKVSCEGGYENVVNYLLGRVAVCRDLDSALAMTGKVPGLRLVTLAGERIDPAGAITGGSFKSDAGNLISRKNEKEKLGIEFENIQTELERAVEQRADINGQISAADLRSDELDEALRVVETRIAVFEKEGEQLRAAGSDAENAWNLKLAEIVELKKEIENTSEGISAALKQVDDSRLAVDAAEEKAAQIAGRIEELRLRSDEARQQETAARLEQAAATVKAE
ncbi:MAG: chromosome segregation protein SMC, partial [Clostridiales bacterium]|nr:chromosome segregation protein SMC [Clostridiales bacterium]